MDNLEEMYSKSSFNTPKDNSMTIDIDEVFKKKLGFLGTFQQVMGVLGIIVGAFYCLTILLAVLGVPVIIMSLKVFKAGGAYKDALMNSNGEDLKRGLCDTSDASKIYVIFIIIFIVIYIIAIIFIIILAIAESSYYY